MQGIAAYADNSIVPPGAITSIRKAADMLEGFGREGDIYVVHAAEGETVVPMEVLNSSPKLKAMLFQQMTELGLEPERYIVGNELNSINPVTGKPEFFLKRILSGLKGAFKKVAPIIGAVAGSIIAPGIGTAIGTKLGGTAAAMAFGNIASNALTSGVASFATSKLAGADTDDALRGALFAGATGGAIGGIQSLLSPAPRPPRVEITPSRSGDFFANPNFLDLPGEPEYIATQVYTRPDLSLVAQRPLMAGRVDPNVRIATPVRSVGGTAQPFSSPISAEGVAAGLPRVQTPTAIGGSGPSFMTPMVPEGAASGLPAQVTAPPRPLPPFGDYAVPAQPQQSVFPTVTRSFSSPTAPEGALIAQLRPPFPGVPGEPGIGMPKGIFGRTDSALRNISTSQPSGIAGFFNEAGQFIRGIPSDLLQLAKENKAQTAMLLGGAGLGVLGALEEQKKAEEAEKAANRRKAQLQAYIADATARYRRPYIRREAGGKVPGKGQGDIVPAMLEPGEFVMNRKAVIGAGNGSQKAGIKRMYAMMRQFEGKS
tara:strand:+ start:22 stop:1644 length:1623 start_codon:yes stop_codon:yes gene_type:complete